MKGAEKMAQPLTDENILKNQVNTVQQFKILAYLKQHFNLNEVSLYLVDRYTIRLVDKNNKQGYFKYDDKTKDVKLYEKNMKKKERAKK